MDKITSPELDDKLDRHLLLRHGYLMYNEEHVLVGAASESYYVNHISICLCSMYPNTTPTERSRPGRPGDDQCILNNSKNRIRKSRGKKSCGHKFRDGYQSSGRGPCPTFYALIPLMVMCRSRTAVLHRRFTYLKLCTIQILLGLLWTILHSLMYSEKAL